MHFPQLKTAIAVPVMTAMILSTPGTQAMPTAASLVSGVKSLLPRAIEARGFNGMGPVALFLAVKDYLKDRNAVSKEHHFTTQTSNNFLAVRPRRRQQMCTTHEHHRWRKLRYKYQLRGK
jgi:hypothetical protein